LVPILFSRPLTTVEPISHIRPVNGHPPFTPQAVPQLGIRLGICKLAMQNLLEVAESLNGESLQIPDWDIQFVGRLLVPRSSIVDGSVVEQQQVDKAAHEFGYGLYLHLI